MTMTARRSQTASVGMVLAFAYLCMFGLFSEPVKASLEGDYSSHMNKLGFLHQFSILCLAIEAKVHIKDINCFSPQVLNVYGANGGGAAATAKVAVSLSVFNVVNLCIRLNALIKVHPGLFNILLSKADTFSSALRRVDDEMRGKTESGRTLFNVKNSPGFNAALTKAGVPNIPCLIDFAILIHIAVLCNQIFVQILCALIPLLAAVLAAVIALVAEILCIVSALLAPILAVVFGLLGGILCTIGALLGGLVFPCLWQILCSCFPNITSAGGPLSPGMFEGMFPLPSPRIYPSGPFVKCNDLFTLINTAC